MRITATGLVFDSSTVDGPLRVCSFCSLLQRENGTLLVSFRRGSSKDSDDGNVVICESTDCGSSWFG